MYVYWTAQIFAVYCSDQGFDRVRQTW